MKFRIHFILDDYEDYVDISGEDLEDVRKNVNDYFEQRGFTYYEVGAWSEEIKENSQ